MWMIDTPEQTRIMVDGAKFNSHDIGSQGNDWQMRQINTRLHIIIIISILFPYKQYIKNQNNKNLMGE